MLDLCIASVMTLTIRSVAVNLVGVGRFLLEPQCYVDIFGFDLVFLLF